MVTSKVILGLLGIGFWILEIVMLFSSVCKARTGDGRYKLESYKCIPGRMRGTFQDDDEYHHLHGSGG